MTPAKVDDQTAAKRSSALAGPPGEGGVPPEPSAKASLGKRRLILLGGLGAVLALGGLLYLRASSGTNHVALASLPKQATVVPVKHANFRPTRTYVGTLEPWVMARIGPQFVSAYVDTVLVRPGAVVKRNAVIATLDCRNASATSRAVTAQARAVEATQAALAKQASRVSGLLDGGFVSPNEVDQRTAESASKEAQLAALQAQMMGSSLQVGDCILRAPFDGEVAERSMDPGAFARPGSSIVTEVDRSAVRVTADVPEEDFELVAPGTPVKILVLANQQTVDGTIARRAPSADGSTRTIHIEMDLPNPNRTFPVGTTAELHLEVGTSKPASEIPLAAATVRGSKASVFIADNGVAKALTLPVLGERGGSLFLDPSLPAGAQVVIEGRAGLSSGDRLVVKAEGDAP